MDAVGAWLGECIAAGRMPGAAWSVAGTDGTALDGAAGHAALEPEPVETSLDTLYDLASLTKPLVTALALVRLEQRGVLSLEAPIGEWVPEFAGSDYANRSLAQFAAHCAGLPAWKPLARGGGGIERALEEIAVEEPGEAGRPLYTDLGYVALGAAVERAGGTPLDAWFEAEVAGPLGLPSIGYATRLDCSNAAPTERGNVFERSLAGDAGAGIAWREALIRGEPHDGNAYALGGVAGHAGLFGTVRDVAALGLMILESGWLDDKARARVLGEAFPGTGRTIGFVQAHASGAGRGVLPDAAPGHVGFAGTSLWLDPDAGLVYVLLTNRVHPVAEERDFQPVRAGFHRAARGCG